MHIKLEGSISNGLPMYNEQSLYSYRYNLNIVQDYIYYS